MDDKYYILEKDGVYLIWIGSSVSWCCVHNNQFVDVRRPDVPKKYCKALKTKERKVTYQELPQHIKVALLLDSLP